jgi:hypothetical protein
MSAEDLEAWGDRDPDDAGPVSGQPAYVEVAATWCVHDDGVDGGLIFGDDEPLERLDEIEDFPGPDGSRVARSVWRVRSGNLRLLGHSVVTTTYPYASDWYEVATFKAKAPQNPSKEQLYRTRWALLVAAGGDPAALKLHPYDLVETNPAYLTALLYRPHRLAPDLTTGVAPQPGCTRARSGSGACAWTSPARARASSCRPS